MDFLKSHYEKVLLSLVLLGLAVVAALLPQKVGDAAPPPPNVSSKVNYEPVPLSTNEVVLARLTNDARTTLAGAHNLFNPVDWKRNSQNSPLIKIDSPDKWGVRALVATNLNPLYLTMTFDGAVSSGDAMRYKIGVTREGEPSPISRQTTPVMATLNDKRDLFTIMEINGPPDNPTSLVVELAKNNQRITVAQDKPYKAIEGYTIDLKYPPENQAFYRKRDRLHSTREFEYTVVVAGETNNIVAIDTNQVVLSALSTGMRTTIPIK